MADDSLSRFTGAVAPELLEKRASSGRASGSACAPKNGVACLKRVDTMRRFVVVKHWEIAVRNLVQSIYLDSELGVSTDLDPAGTALENPYVYDSAARDLKAMADKGLVKIMTEQIRRGAGSQLIERISFERLR